MDGLRMPAQETLMKRNGFVTVGMLIIAGSLGMMLMARHTDPPAEDLSAAPAESGAEAGLGAVHVMQALQPFDEHFVADAAE